MNKKLITALGLTLSLILVGSGMAWAGTPTTYAIEWQVIDGGGQPVVSSGGDVTLEGSIGQPLIGDAQSTDGNITLQIGYWEEVEAVEVGTTIYLPLVIKGENP